MPPKRPKIIKSVVKDISNKGKHPKSGNKIPQPEASQINLYNEEEQMYLLQKEKSLLMSKIQQMKKDLFEMRAALKQREFQALQHTENEEEKFPEFSEKVEIWSKYFGMTINQAVYTKNETRQWHIEVSGDNVKFEMDISCASNELTQKGFIEDFTIVSFEPCKQDLQPWFDRFKCNTEQIFKLFKVYDEMNKKRQNGLDMCKEEFGSIVTFYQVQPSGETVVELGNKDTYYFQIKWKLSPSTKHIAKVKNVCRMACTEEGNEYIKSNSDLSNIKKKLSETPIYVIQLLARGIAKHDIGK